MAARCSIGLARASVCGFSVGLNDDMTCVFKYAGKIFAGWEGSQPLQPVMTLGAGL